MTRPELLLGPGAVEVTESGLRLSIRQPWYRSLPLSSVVDLEVSVDGESVNRDALRMRVDGEDYGLDDLPARWDTVWFIQDAAEVDVPVALEPGPAHVEVALTLRFPYIIIDGVGPLRRRTTATADVHIDRSTR
ncbi:C-glycoside deglycosidase beta subunit domain-containing protein [Microbacterium hydrothermale]|uniref:C-glycoside deglycosidase beta subunit domain-containing protein n=1 Tax=Microbacterium hydrothermale TaxID=857427 RepID=UPI0010A8AF07|nr:DUF6379 domain-containing protein [Microbacterium hydrothermale]